LEVYFMFILVIIVPTWQLRPPNRFQAGLSVNVVDNQINHKKSGRPVEHGFQFS